MLCSTKINIVLLKICWTKNAPRSPPQPQKCTEWTPVDSSRPCALQGALAWRAAVGSGPRLRVLHARGVALTSGVTPDCSRCPLLSLRVTPLPGARLGPFLRSQGSSAGQQCRRLSVPELADCILENSMCVFFPCNLTLGRDSLIGVAS